MRVTEVSYSMKRVTKTYENDTATVTVEVSEGDSPAIALEKARTLCDESLAAGRDAHLRDKLKEMMSTAPGRAALEQFLRCRGNIPY
jgi:hypothetical protein